MVVLAVLELIRGGLSLSHRSLMRPRVDQRWPFSRPVHRRRLSAIELTRGLLSLPPLIYRRRLFTTRFGRPNRTQGSHLDATVRHLHNKEATPKSCSNRAMFLFIAIFRLLLRPSFQGSSRWSDVSFLSHRSFIVDVWDRLSCCSAGKAEEPPAFLWGAAATSSNPHREMEVLI